MPQPARLLRLGTRRSPLAMAQSGTVARALESAHSGLRVELVPIITSGDRTRGALAEVGGKGLFTQELEEGLIRGELDLAVHSLKDLPAVLPEELQIAAFPERADYRDALISTVADALDSLAPGATILTGSLRRRAQLLCLRPDLRVTAVRGNVDTRLRKWRESGAAGVLLAAAGLARLGHDDLPLHPLDAETFIPAPGQGTLAIETRPEGPAAELCAVLNHPATARAARAERAVVRAFGADCRLPIAAWARPQKTGILLTAWIGHPDGTSSLRSEAFADEPEVAAASCVDTLREQGADALLEAALR
jgi:hydroxymethylbilane synthase